VSPPRVAIIDDHPLLWPSLTAALTERGFEVAAVVGTVGELPAEPFDLVICDLHLPEEPSGPAGISFLVSKGFLVLAMSGIANRETALDAIEAGAVGFVDKTLHAPQVADAAWTTVTDGCHISPTLAKLLVQDAKRRPLPAGTELPARHLAVLRALEQGDAVAEIAQTMRLTARGVIDVMTAIFDAGRRRRSRLRPTVAELEVIKLVACRNLSRQEIADELLISPWTVTSRLESARDKYFELHPELDHGHKPREIAHMWAKELDLCPRGA
jgi:two-component system, NarL family, nitrate/nitrite response regulator NarL